MDVESLCNDVNKALLVTLMEDTVFVSLIHSPVELVQCPTAEVNNT